MNTPAINANTETAQVVSADPQGALLPADPMVSMIERVAMDPASDIAKLERMLEMKERHDAANAKAAFAAAFASASTAFPDIPKNGEGHNKMPYATLKDIISHTRPVLSENGLALTFGVDTTGQKVRVTAKLMHKSGHVETTSIDLPSDGSGSKNAVQAVGSSQTYGQRYTAQAILGLSLGEDTEDDGRSSGRAPDAPKRSTDPWTQTIIDELPDNSTPREKAEAVADALCGQFRRMKGERQLGNEWDRRRHLIEGDKGFQGKHRDLYDKVIDAYENRMIDIQEQARD